MKSSGRKHWPKFRIEKIKSEELANKHKKKLAEQKIEAQIAMGELALNQTSDDYLEGYGEIADNLRDDLGT